MTAQSESMTADLPEINRPPEAMLAYKMAQAMGLLQRIDKNGENKDQHWKYATVDDIMDAVRSAMSMVGLALFARMTSHNEVKDGRVTTATVEIEFKVVCADTGAYEIMPWTGQASDYSDKALNKAATYAAKFWLKNTFLVSTGDEPDAESPGDERSGQRQRSRDNQQQRSGNDLMKPGVQEQRQRTQQRQPPEPQAGTTPDQKTVIVRRAIHSKHITFPEAAATWFKGRAELANLIGNEAYVKEAGILTWAGIEKKPLTYEFPGLRLTLTKPQGKNFFEIVKAEPVIKTGSSPLAAPPDSPAGENDAPDPNNLNDWFGPEDEPDYGQLEQDAITTN